MRAKFELLQRTWELCNVAPHSAGLPTMHGTTQLVEVHDYQLVWASAQSGSTALSKHKRDIYVWRPQLPTPAAWDKGARCSQLRRTSWLNYAASYGFVWLWCWWLGTTFLATLSY